MRKKRAPSSKPAKSKANRNLAASNKTDSPDSRRDAVNVGNMTDEQKLQDGQLPVNHRIEKAFSGPLPSPEDFEGYNRALPGAADRIISMAEKEQQIRADGQDGILANDRRRINGAILIGLALIGIAGFAAWNGSALIAIPLGLAGVVGSVIRQLLVWLNAREKPKK